MGVMFYEAPARPHGRHDGDRADYNMANIILRETSYESLLEATKYFRLKSSAPRPRHDDTIRLGVLPKFIEFLTWDAYPRLQFEAAWVLTNIAAGDNSHAMSVVREGAIPNLLHLLKSEDRDAREQAVWAIGNISGDTTTLRDQVLDAGALPLLATLAQPDAEITFLRNLTWTISNLGRGKPKPTMEKVACALPILVALLNHEDEEVLTDACWAFSYISDGSDDDIQMVVDLGVSKRLVELLGHSSNKVKTPALRVIGNIVTGNENHTDAILDANPLPYFKPLLSDEKLKKEACWSISNITAGSIRQIQAVIDAEIIPALLGVISDASNIKQKREAVYAISNGISGGTWEQIGYFVAQGCISKFCDVLKLSDSEIQRLSLEALEKILKAGDVDHDSANQHAVFLQHTNGFRAVSSLAQDPRLHDICTRILEKYNTASTQPADNTAEEVCDPSSINFVPMRTSLLTV